MLFLNIYKNISPWVETALTDLWCNEHSWPLFWILQEISKGKIFSVSVCKNHWVNSHFSQFKSVQQYEADQYDSDDQQNSTKKEI